MLRRIGCLLLALLVAPTPWASAQERLRVFVLAGQSNMQGQAVVDLDDPRDYNGGKGNLEWVMAHSEHRDSMKHLRQANGEWTVRDDVFIRYRTEHELKRGPLSIGFAVYGGQHHFGPELQLGHIVGDHYDEPVLLIKTSWGGKSLFQDFRPPSSSGETGAFYTQMLAEVEEAIREIPNDFPHLANHQPKIEAFVWFQGWNDMIDARGREEYTDNFVNLVHDLRSEWKQPELPIIIGETGNGGANVDENLLSLRRSQAAAAERILPEGSARFVETHTFARPAEESPNTGHGHHWFGNAESFFLIGDGLGKAVIELVE